MGWRPKLCLPRPAGLRAPLARAVSQPPSRTPARGTWPACPVQPARPASQRAAELMRGSDATRLAPFRTDTPGAATNSSRRGTAFCHSSIDYLPRIFFSFDTLQSRTPQINHSPWHLAPPTSYPADSLTETCLGSPSLSSFNSTMLAPRLCRRNTPQTPTGTEDLSMPPCRSETNNRSAWSPSSGRFRLTAPSRLCADFRVLSFLLPGCRPKIRAPPPRLYPRH